MSIRFFALAFGVVLMAAPVVVSGAGKPAPQSASANSPASAKGPVSAKAPTPAMVAAFRTNCAICHGVNAQGGAGPSLRPLKIPLADVRSVVREGRGQMPAFGPKDLPEPALAQAIGYLKAVQ